jgi:hypothetical protein
MDRTLKTVWRFDWKNPEVAGGQPRVHGKSTGYCGEMKLGTERGKE